MKYSFGTLTITDESKKLIAEILESNNVTQGRYVRELEEKFADIVGVKEAIAVSSGTDAVALALAVLYDYGATRNDEIIVPALSFVATGNAILQAGFRPVFVDIDRGTLNIDTNLIEDSITESTRAILPVHLIGKPSDMDSIKRIADKYKLIVIEDAAEAYGMKHNNKNAGSIGDMGCFSLYAAHITSAVEGGMITTNNSKYAEIVRSLRSHGRACKCKKCLLNEGKECGKRFKTGEDIRFIMERIGFSCKMNELEAAVGLGNLEIYDEILSTRRKNLLYLQKQFKQFNEYFYTIKEDDNETIGPHAFPIIIKENQKFTRNQYVECLEKNGIDSRSLFSSMPTQCNGFKFLGYKLGDFPESEYVGNNGLHIGIHQDITVKKMDYFIDITKKFIKEIA